MTSGCFAVLGGDPDTFPHRHLPDAGEGTDDVLRFGAKKHQSCTTGRAIPQSMVQDANRKGCTMTHIYIYTYNGHYINLYSTIDI